MNVINVEIYSVVILLVLIIDYLVKFKKKLNMASIIWLSMAISTLFISVSNILVNLTDIYTLKILSMSMYLLFTLLSSLFAYVYIKYVYMTTNISVKKEIHNIFCSILVCFIITFIYVFIANKGYELHSFNRSFFNRLLILAVIPNLVICIMYVHSIKHNKTLINNKVVFTLLLTVIALILDIITDSFFFVSATYTITTLIIYINKHDQLLNTDSLTGLANKRSLEFFLNNLKPNLIVATYNIDIDKFKNINDKYGHLQGDIVLRSVASILKNSSRNADLVIRNGGDEFLIIAIIKKRTDAKKILNRIYGNLKKYNDNEIIKISLSIGWGIYLSKEKNNMSDFLDFLKETDDKMYKQKAINHKKLF